MAMRFNDRRIKARYGTACRLAHWGATQVININYRTIFGKDCRSVAMLSAMDCAKAHRLNRIDNFLPKPSVHRRVIGAPMRNE